MEVYDASYGVLNTSFKTLFFSDIKILLNSEINYDFIALFLKNPSDHSKVAISDCLTIDFDTRTIQIRGYELSNTMYITSTDSKIEYVISNPKSNFHTVDLISRLHHMYVTV